MAVGVQCAFGKKRCVHLRYSQSHVKAVSMFDVCIMIIFLCSMNVEEWMDGWMIEKGVLSILFMKNEMQSGHKFLNVPKTVSSLFPRETCHSRAKFKILDKCRETAREPDPQRSEIVMYSPRGLGKKSFSIVLCCVWVVLWKCVTQRPLVSGTDKTFVTSTISTNNNNQQKWKNKYILTKKRRQLVLPPPPFLWNVVLPWFERKCFRKGLIFCVSRDPPLFRSSRRPLTNGRRCRKRGFWSRATAGAYFRMSTTAPVKREEVIRSRVIRERAGFSMADCQRRRTARVHETSSDGPATRRFRTCVTEVTAWERITSWWRNSGETENAISAAQVVIAIVAMRSSVWEPPSPTTHLAAARLVISSRREPRWRRCFRLWRSGFRSCCWLVATTKWRTRNESIEIFERRGDWDRTKEEPKRDKEREQKLNHNKQISSNHVDFRGV